jgi:uncharacterized protein YjbI with pentapeptide repeats
MKAIYHMDDVELQAHYLKMNGFTERQIKNLLGKYENEEFDDVYRMSYTVFVNCVFTNYVSQRYMTIRGSVFTNVTFDNCYFNDVQFIDCEFNNCTFINNNKMRNTDFIDCTLLDSTMPSPDIDRGITYLVSLYK